MNPASAEILMKSDLSTLEIEIEMIAVFNPKINIVVPNVSWGMGKLGGKDLHECDILILSKRNYATEIEIKTSKPDLLADKKKLHAHRHNHIARLYFAVPEKLVELALGEIPERAGLYEVKRNCDPVLIKQCKRNKNCVRWSDHERFKLAHLGAMRILGLKEKIAKLQSNTQMKF